jgi:hypothetical protein
VGLCVIAKPVGSNTIASPLDAILYSILSVLPTIQPCNFFHPHS